MRIIMSFLKPYRVAMVIALLLMLVELMVELFHPLLMSKVIDNGIVHQDLSVVLFWGGVMIVISLLGFVGGIVNSFFAAHVSQNFGFEIRKSLFTKVQSIPFAQFNQFQTSSLITRITSDVTQLQNTVFMGLRIMMRAPLFMIFGMVMAMMVHFKVALILVVITPLLILLLVWMMKRAFSLFRSVQERLDQTNGVLRENLMGIRLIKALVRGNHEIKRFSQTNEALMDRTMAALRLIELTIPLLLLVMNLSILFILWSGHLQVNTGDATIGQIVAVVNYATRITGLFSTISMLVMALSRAKASATRVAEVLSSPEDIDNSVPVSAAHQITKGSIVFDNVSFRYPDMTEDVLKSISFKARSGETIAVLGATGSGKTSLFQLIPRLYESTQGRIRIDGHEIRTFNPSVLRSEIGYVPQEVVLFTGSVKENIMWGCDNATMEEVIEAAQKAQIHETILSLPQQYETIVGQKGVNLSGGQKQRISIARALLRKPKLLLLDDSTSALDVRTESRLLEALRTLRCTTLIITQKIATAIAADTVLLLEEGSLLASGDHQELLALSALYREIVQSQIREENVQHA
ncbi:ABC transporter ATP-binding protein [Paenibacillus sp. FSL H7-0331]|uniref:ABC transporter ATP-binding protein n=1 Tax=Paenibacillus sp. FSL H7-0331 TaxID=1920421 RepID=UPI00096DDF66|nr:ABC transporter ATP-binding protein [Paenibacillus sp. FSL H7-0331]OMF18446.1 ABC transporter ATP-binding protein [Paenibacillus sp. FSL H7-0331]